MDSKSISVSVVIPVFNAEKFVERAVKSALNQPETSEVILVEDGSPDNSYEVCQTLENKYQKVQLFIHPGRENKGAGASRNLGIKKASSNLIAFLDADDFYLEKRFKKAKEIFHENEKADGVYEAVGTHFYNKKVKKEWVYEREKDTITTISQPIEPEDLFWVYSQIGSRGTAHLDGLTIKKNALEKVKFFNPDLRLHQDSDLFMRLAIACKLYPGSIKEPVAMRGVHNNNRITAERSLEETISHQKKMWYSIYQWTLKNGYHREADEIINRIRHFRIHLSKQYPNESLLTKLRQVFITITGHPYSLLEMRMYRSLIKLFYLHLKMKFKF